MPCVFAHMKEIEKARGEENDERKCSIIRTAGKCCNGALSKNNKPLPQNTQNTGSFRSFLIMILLAKN